MHLLYTNNKCSIKLATEESPWVSINSNNKMISRLTSLRYLLIKTDMKIKKY